MIKILDEVMKGLPDDAKINDAVFEGADIVLYTKNKNFFLDNKGVIKEIVDNIKKRVEVRADPSIVLDIEDTKKKIYKIMPEDTGKLNVIFDPQRSRVIIEAEKPGLAIGKDGGLIKDIRKETLWTPIVRRIPPMRSQLIENIRQVLYDFSDYRRKFLHKVGKRIYEGWTKDRRDEWVRITCLGSAREVGRSCFLLQTPESKVIMDCGFNVAAPKDHAYPYLDAPEFNIQELDAVIITHSHIDHCLPPDIPIELEGGVIKPIDKIEEGDKLVTINWKTGKKEIGECIKKIRTYTHKELIKIKTPYYTIEASPNHKFFIVDGMKIKEVEAKDLKEGMIVPCNLDENNNKINSIILKTEVDYRERLFLPEDARSYFKKLRDERNLSQKALCKVLNKSRNYIYTLEHKNNYIYKKTLNQILQFYGVNSGAFYSKFGIQQTRLPEKLDFNLAQCLGYVAGDGHPATENSIRITEQSRKCLEVYSDLFNETFNYKPGIAKHSDRSKNALVAEICNAGILRYINNNFDCILKRSPSREIPKQIILSSNNIIRGFIRGFADAEGCVKDAQISIDSSSEKIIQQLQFMLNRLGIEATLSEGRTSGFCDNLSYRINIHSKNGIKKFSELIGFNHPKKKHKLKKLLCSIKNIKTKNDDFVPIGNLDVRNIIKDLGFGNGCSDIILKKHLPGAIFAVYSGDTLKLSRQAAVKLENFLEKRVYLFTQIINSNGIKKKRLFCGLSKKEFGNIVDLSIDKISQIENKKNEQFKDMINNKLNSILKNMKENSLETLRKLRFFMNSEVKWQKITKIKKYKNTYPYLVDIKVSNNSNFIANGVIVHNCGALPFLYKMGFRGPTYLTAPCRDISALLCLDLVEIAQKEGNDPPYTVNDVKEFVKHCICLDYEQVADITPDIRLTLYNAGHTLGSSLAHLHVGNGLTNLVYSGDFNYETSNLLSSANTKFPRVETVMMESTYGTRSDTSPTRKESEDELIKVINEVAEEKGKVLMPVLGVGRSQEIMLILEKAMRENRIPQMPIYIQGMVWDVTAIHTAYPDFLSSRVRKEIFQHDQNPFLSPIFKKVVSQKEMQEVKDSKGPFVVMATSGMMTGGTSVEYFKHFAENPKNALVFTCYQGVGSLGRRIEEGEKEMNFLSGGSKRQETLKVLMKVQSIKGFSGHSSFKQLVSWVGNLEPRPKKIITIHGDYSRCIELASVLYQQYRVETVAPKNLETIRLR